MMMKHNNNSDGDPTIIAVEGSTFRSKLVWTMLTILSLDAIYTTFVSNTQLHSITYNIYGNIRLRSSSKSSSSFEPCNTTFVTQTDAATPPPAKLIYDDFDFSQPDIEVPCGNNKCFIQSKSNPTEEGYLIGENKTSKNFQQAYDYAQYLSETYSITNVLLGPPFNLTRDFDIINQINQRTYKSFDVNRNGKNPPSKFCSSSNNNNITSSTCKSIPLTIQKVRRYDEKNTIEVKCRNHAMNNTRNHWIQKQLEIQQQHNNSNIDEEAKNKTTMFIRQFQYSIDETNEMLKNEPEFMTDLQFIVDLSSGQIIHIDYDRFLLGRKKLSKHPKSQLVYANETRIRCMEFLQEMKHDIITKNLYM